MEKLAQKLLPLLLAVVAGVVLATGIRGFRAERPSLPAAIGRLTTPFITEAPDPGIEIRLDGDEKTILKPGTADHELAEHLAGPRRSERSFPLPRIEDAGNDAEDVKTSFQLRRLAAILRLHPDAKVEIRGAAAGRLRDLLQARGLSEDWITVSPDIEAQDNPSEPELVVHPDN